MALPDLAKVATAGRNKTCFHEHNNKHAMKRIPSSPCTQDGVTLGLHNLQRVAGSVLAGPTTLFGLFYLLFVLDQVGL